MEAKIAVDLVQDLRTFCREHVESDHLCMKNCFPDKEAVENRGKELLQIGLVGSGSRGLDYPLDQDNYFADTEVSVPAFAWVS